MVNTGLAYFRVANDLRGAMLLPELLGESGYSTFATGKWHNGEESWLRGFQRGQALFFGGMSDHSQVPLVDLVGSGELGNERIGQKLSIELFADAAIDFLESYRGEQPFYAYVAFTAPHDPRMLPQEFRDYYHENLPPLPDNFLPLHPFNPGDAMLTIRDEQLAAWPRTEEVIRDQIAEYYGLISHLDGQIGRVLDALRASDHADNTIVVYAADHGLAIGSHGLLGKQNVYEHSQKCPLIFAGPGIPHGESEAYTYLLDIFPTVTALASAPTAADLDGADLSAIWSGEATGVRDSVFLA
jgi:arylsulfatase A-like enzyme